MTYNARHATRHDICAATYRYWNCCGRHQYAGTLRYDLVRTNARKVACVAAFTILALAGFIYQGLVLWVPGLTLAVGSMLGAHIAVKFAISARPSP